MRIDAHTHWLPEKIIENAHFYHKGWGDIENHLKMMDACAIDKAVLSYPTSDAHLKLGSISQVARIFNDSIARLMKHYPGRFIGAAVLPVDNKQSMLEELQRCRDLGFSAISLATSYNGIYLDSELFIPVYEEASRQKLPVFVHSQIVNPIGSERVRDPLLTPVIEYVFDTTMCVGKLLMSGILKDFDVNFIFGYFAGVTPFLAHRFDATYRMLRGIDFVQDLGAEPTQYLKKIYVDTSGDTTRSNLDAALALFGAEHMLWGSDWPAKKDPLASVSAINDLPIKETEKQEILGENLKRLLNC